MDPEQSTFGQCNVSENHSVQTCRCQLRRYDARLTRTRLHARKHACTHAHTHARLHARMHVHHGTQETHQNEMRCGMCFNATAAAAVRIWLAGFKNDAGSKSCIRWRAASRPRMPTTPRRCRQCGTKLPACRAASGGRKTKREQDRTQECVCVCGGGGVL